MKTDKTFYRKILSETSIVLVNCGLSDTGIAYRFIHIVAGRDRG